MRNLICGCIGMLLGGNILLGSLMHLVKGNLIEGSDPYYKAGQLLAVLLGPLMYGAGLHYFVKGCKQVYSRGSQRATAR